MGRGGHGTHGGHGGDGASQRARRLDKAGVGILVGGAFGVLMCVALIVVMIWIIVATARKYLFPATPGYAIERIDVAARLKTNGDVVVTQTERLRFPSGADGFDIPLPLSSATVDQLEERGVEDTGLTVDAIRDETHGIDYVDADEPAAVTNGDPDRTYSVGWLTRAASVSGPQPRGRSTWTVRYTLDDNALTWSDAGELVWRYGRALEHQPVPEMHVVLAFDGSLDGAKGVVGTNLSAQVAEDYRAKVAVSPGRGVGADAGKAKVVIDTALAGGRTGTLHAMFPRDWIVDSPMPEPKGDEAGDGRGAERMAEGLAFDRELADDLARTRLKATAIDLAWRLPLGVSLVFLIASVVTLLRRRIAMPRALFRDRTSDEPILVDEPWLLTGLVGRSDAPRFFAAALMRATLDGTVRIIDPKRGFPAPEGVSVSPRRAWRLHYDGPIVHDPKTPGLPIAAVNAICGCDGIETQLARNLYQNVDEPFTVPARARGFDADPTMMDDWARRSESLCGGMMRTAGRASGDALKATGWVVSTGALGRFVGVVMGLGLPVAALVARLHTDDWTGFWITVAAALSGAVCCMFLRAYAGDGVDNHARAEAIRRWFKKRRWDARADEGTGRRGLLRKGRADGHAAGFVTDPERARGLLVDAVALGIDERAIEGFAGRMVSWGVLAADDPAVWWCRRNGRGRIPAVAWAAVYATCSVHDDGSDTSIDPS